MDRIESVVLSMLIALARTAWLALRMGTERRDVGLLNTLTALRGMGTFAVLTA